MSGVDVLADLRGVIRIAKAASVGVTGNELRIERAEKAVAAIAELIAAADERERLRPAYLASIPAGSEVCTSPERDAYFASVARFDDALAACKAVKP